jgi:hypothetical protein
VISWFQAFAFIFSLRRYTAVAVMVEEAEHVAAFANYTPPPLASEPTAASASAGAAAGAGSRGGG